MATKTFEELKQLAIQIRDEKTNKQNTATRVGTAMLEHINKLEQDYYDKTTINNRTSEYNVSINHPTSGISSSNKYDLSSAIAQVPAELRTAGLKVSFLNSAGKPESWKYQGGSWAVANFIKEADGGNKILTWVTDAATTRKQVAANERKGGMQISYKPNGEDWVNEQYIGTSFTDSEWEKDSNWEQIPNEKQVTYLNKQVQDNKKSKNIKKEADQLIIKDIQGNEILNLDKDGLSVTTLNVAKEIKGEGLNKSVASGVERSKIRQLSSESDELAVMDANGHIIFYIDKGGFVHTIKEPETIIPTKLKSDINLILSYGQSLSVYGGNDFGVGVGGVPSVYPYYNNILKFANIDGADVQTAISNATDLESIDLDDILGTEFSQLESGETIHNLGHFALYYDKLLIEKNHYTEEQLPKFLLASCGEPGVGIPSLENKQYYNRIIASVKQGLKIALSNNLSFNIPFLAWLQAEGNYGKDYDGVYKGYLLNLFDKINTDVKAITGQTNDIIFICYNPCTEVYHDYEYNKKNDKALQIIEAEQERDNIVHGSAMHIFGYGDELHTSGNSYKLIGSFNALQAYNIMEENKEIPILIPKSHSVIQGNDNAYYIQLDYDVMYPPLQFKQPNDNILNPNYSKIVRHGFRILASERADFTTDDTNIIQDVTISENGKSIILRCSQDPTGKILTYAWDGFYGGGDVCDSASKVLPQASWTSFNKDIQILSDVDNYLPIYRLTI